MSSTTLSALLARLMPYDVYERHAVTSRLLTMALGHLDVAHVLDVGGRAELLARFLPWPVTSVNVDGSGRLWGSGLALPFADGAFAAVVSIDTLEHLPGERRESFLRECLRVAQSHVLVAAPFGSAGHSAYEARLDELYRAAHGAPHPYLAEHVQYGLPGSAEIDYWAETLPAARVRRFFAGDYVWQGKQFERTIRQPHRTGLLARLAGVYADVTSRALFHPIRLREQASATTNRFYLLIQKG